MPLETPVYDADKSRRIVILIAATCLMFAAVWAYVFLLRKPRVADGALQTITAVPLHSELRQGGTMSEGYGGGVESMDEMLVWVSFRMKNLTGDTPLYETRQRATLTLPDGEQKFAYAESPSEIEKLRQVPKIQQVTGTLVPREMTLAPGMGTQGMALFVFPVTKQVWDTRREFSVAVSFQWQRDLAMREITNVP